LIVFSDDDFNLSVFVSFSTFEVDFLGGDFSSETFFDFSARSVEVFSDDWTFSLDLGTDVLSVCLLDDFSDGFSDILSEDLTGVDDIGLFDSSDFELFKIDFIVGLDLDSTLSFSTVFDTTGFSVFFGEFLVLSDFLSANFVPASLSSDFSFLSVSFVAGVFAGSGIGS